MTGLDELLTFPMDEDVYEGTGGGNILDEPYILLQRDKQTAEQEQTVPLILTSDPNQQSVKSLKTLSAANIDAINGLTALKLFMTPSDVPNELQQYIYNNQNIINQPYTSIQEIIPKQILFISLCHQICFYSPMSFRKTFPEKFRSARNILNTRTLQLDLFWDKLTNALGVTDVPLQSMLDLFSKTPAEIKNFIQETIPKPEDSSAVGPFGKAPPIITPEMEQAFNNIAKKYQYEPFIKPGILSPEETNIVIQDFKNSGIPRLDTITYLIESAIWIIIRDLQTMLNNINIELDNEDENDNVNTITEFINDKNIIEKLLNAQRNLLFKIENTPPPIINHNPVHERLDNTNPLFKDIINQTLKLPSTVQEAIDTYEKIEIEINKLNNNALDKYKKQKSTQQDYIANPTDKTAIDNYKKALIDYKRSAERKLRLISSLMLPIIQELINRETNKLGRLTKYRGAQQGYLKEMGVLKNIINKTNERIHSLNPTATYGGSRTRCTRKRTSRRQTKRQKSNRCNK